MLNTADSLQLGSSEKKKMLFKPWIIDWSTKNQLWKNRKISSTFLFRWNIFVHFFWEYDFFSIFRFCSQEMSLSHVTQKIIPLFWMLFISCIFNYYYRLSCDIFGEKELHSNLRHVPFLSINRFKYLLIMLSMGDIVT